MMFGLPDLQPCIDAQPSVAGSKAALSDTELVPDRLSDGCAAFLQAAYGRVVWVGCCVLRWQIARWNTFYMFLYCGALNCCQHAVSTVPSRLAAQADGYPMDSMTRTEVEACMRGPSGSVAVLTIAGLAADSPHRLVDLERRALPQPPLQQVRTPNQVIDRI